MPVVIWTMKSSNLCIVACFAFIRACFSCIYRTSVFAMMTNFSRHRRHFISIIVWHYYSATVYFFYGIGFKTCKLWDGLNIYTWTCMYRYSKGVPGAGVLAYSYQLLVRFHFSVVRGSNHVQGALNSKASKLPSVHCLAINRRKTLLCILGTVCVKWVLAEAHGNVIFSGFQWLKYQTTDFRRGANALIYLFEFLCR